MNNTEGLRFETTDEIERDLEQTFKQYALADPQSFFSETGARFSMVATAFIERLRASEQRESKQLLNRESKEV